MDHAFTWEHGRVLGAWQIVWIASGEGEFQGKRRGAIERVTAGEAIFVAPGQWHRYRPSPRTGWTEWWVELEGPVLGRLTEAGLLPTYATVNRQLDPAATSELIASLHRSLRDEASAVEVAAVSLKLLGLFTAQNQPAEAALVRAVRRAERLLSERLAQPLNMPALAQELGVGYAGFRREFKRRTGLAPARYLQRLRLDHAQRLIGAGPCTLDSVAEQLGFSSAFHLSAAFKAQFGVAPTYWRQGTG
ncbi:MAG: AraC family transcriptional regulator [Rariglobus sp.]